MKKESINQFNDALNLDLHPMVTPNSVLTDNLNGTFITYNGNEFCLQNDRGNHSVAKLSEGYVPIGAKEYNGVIYIVSVKDVYDNPDEPDEEKRIIKADECLTEIGTYPGVDWSIAYEKEHDLNYSEYTPLKNIDVITNDDKVTSRGSFSGLKLGYTTQTPVTIEIQPSYDGSANLILTDGKNPVRMINSGFSVQPQNQYKLIKRNQSYATNNYNSDKLDELGLIRTTNKVTNIELSGVQSGGQFKGGNYTFYLKFGDSDYNQTDVVAESGIVSIFKGTDCNPATISGTVLDERTDKMVCLKIIGLNEIYSKMYIYFSREYSDTLGYRLTEHGMFKEPIDVKPDSGKTDEQTIWLTGFEQTETINSEEIKVDYHTFDSARAEAQQQNMLFLGNLKIEETHELYSALEKIAELITISPKQDKILNLVSYKYNSDVNEKNASNSEYYSVENIYKYVGYWPNEYYRFGIVFILKDGTTTPVFNVGQNKGIEQVPRWAVINSTSIKPISYEFVLPTINDDIRNKVLGYFYVRQKRIPITLCQGLRLGIDKRTHLPITWNGKTWLTQSFLSFDRSKYADSSSDNVIKKELPITSESDWVNYIPMLEYIGESISANSKSSKYANKYIPYKIANKDFNKDVNYALLTLDPCVEASIRNILDGSKFKINLEWTTETHFGNSNTPDIIKGEKIDSDGNNLQIKEIFKLFVNGDPTDANCIYVPSNTKIKEINGFAFSNIAGDELDVTKYEFPAWALAMRYDGTKGGGDHRYYWNLNNEFNSVIERKITTTNYDKLKEIGFNSGLNINLIRGLFTPYVGVTADLNADHGIYSINIAGSTHVNNILVREQDESPYFTISKRFDLYENKVSVYGGDCFTTTNSIRIIRNFIDPDVPITNNIVQGDSWHWFYRGYYDNDDANGRAYPVPKEGVPPDRINRADVNTVDLGYWVTYKCLSSYNLGLRSEDRFHEQEMSLLGSSRSFYPLNSGSTATGNKVEESFLLNNGYSATVSEKSYNLLPDVPYTKSEFANRIIFSNVQVDDSFINGYRTFQGLSYKDYDKQYGEIVKLVPWDNNLLVIMEHGIGLVGVNEKALIQTTTSDTIHIYGHGVLSEQMQIISPDYGSKYEHSVIRTPIGVYGIDADARKIWRVSTQKGFETLSDMKIESYLNDKLPEVNNKGVEMEICDIRTHYNETKGDIMFTFFRRKSVNKVAPKAKIDTPAINNTSILFTEIGAEETKRVYSPYSEPVVIANGDVAVIDIINVGNGYYDIVAKSTGEGDGAVIINNEVINTNTVTEAEKAIAEQKELEKQAEEAETPMTLTIDTNSSSKALLVGSIISYTVSSNKPFNINDLTIVNSNVNAVSATIDGGKLKIKGLSVTEQLHPVAVKVTYGDIESNTIYIAVEKANPFYITPKEQNLIVGNRGYIRYYNVDTITMNIESGTEHIDNIINDTTIGFKAISVGTTVITINGYLGGELVGTETATINCVEDVALETLNWEDVEFNNKNVANVTVKKGTLSTFTFIPEPLDYNTRAYTSTISCNEQRMVDLYRSMSFNKYSTTIDGQKVDKGFVQIRGAEVGTCVVEFVIWKNDREKVKTYKFNVTVTE